jgi:hypothetical protein
MILRSLAFLALLIPPDSDLQAEELWSEGRITPEQPFQAKVVAVQPGWGWDTIILKEIDGSGRYCLATFGSPLGDYKIVQKERFDENALKRNGAIFIDPPVEVERFSWSMGSWRHGRLFGDDDAATKNRTKTGEQAGAGQPATGSESKSEGSDTPQPKAEKHSR